MAVLAIAAAIAYGYSQVTRSQVTLDAQTNCPQDKSKITAATVVLLDRTDPLSTVQAAAVKRRLERLRGELKKYELFAMFTVNSTERNLLQPVVELCNPGKGEELAGLVDNPNLARQRWERRFAGPVEQAVDFVFGGAPAASSPILESLQSIGIEPFGRPELDHAPKRLVLISDMVQHTAPISHYRAVPDYASVGHSDPYLRLRSNLRDVSVEIWYLRRSNARAIQGRAHIEFWQGYIQDQGGHLVSVASIEG